MVVGPLALSDAPSPSTVRDVLGPTVSVAFAVI